MDLECASGVKIFDSRIVRERYRSMPPIASRKPRPTSHRRAAKSLCLSAGAVALATQLGSEHASAQVAVAGQLLVDLQATDPSAGTASWQNLGTLGGSFAEVGDASSV